MKKSILTITLLSTYLFGMAQMKKPVLKQDTTKTHAVIAKPDTVYLFHEKDLQRLYSLLQAGYQGVGTSNDFSVNQRTQYLNEYKRIDSAIQPQYKKFHPIVKKP